MDCSPTRLLSPWNFSGKNIGLGCHFFFHRTSPHTENKISSPHCDPHILHGPLQPLYSLSPHTPASSSSAVALAYLLPRYFHAPFFQLLMVSPQMTPLQRILSWSWVLILPIRQFYFSSLYSPPPEIRLYIWWFILTSNPWDACSSREGNWPCSHYLPSR